MRRFHLRKKEQAAHLDDWLITYADMITLLLCFFVVFLIITISKKDATQKPLHPTLEQTQYEQPPPPITTSNAKWVPVEQVKSLEGSLPFHDTSKLDAPEEQVPRDAPAAAENIQTGLAVLPDLDHLKTQLAVVTPATIEQKGDRITSLEMNSGTFFDAGSATLSASGKTILHDVADHLKSDQYQDYQITVEGHTDDNPIRTTQFPSNWELSTARASAVVHYFLEQGIAPQKLRAAGYGDTFPKVPNRDDWGKPVPENQAQNRRVVIKLEKIQQGG